MAKRKPRLRGKPGWVIASLAGSLAWGLVSVIAVAFFEVTLGTALVMGFAACVVVAAPALLVEGIAIAFAIGLETTLGAVAFVVFAPLALLGSCG